MVGSLVCEERALREGNPFLRTRQSDTTGRGNLHKCTFLFVLVFLLLGGDFIGSLISRNVRAFKVKWRLMVTSCYRRMHNYQKALELYEKIHTEHPDNLECKRDFLMNDMFERRHILLPATNTALRLAILGGHLQGSRATLRCVSTKTCASRSYAAGPVRARSAYPCRR